MHRQYPVTYDFIFFISGSKRPPSPLFLKSTVRVRRTCIPTNTSKWPVKYPPKQIPLIDNHGHVYNLFTLLSILRLRSLTLIDPLIKPSAVHLEHIYKTLKTGCAGYNRMSKKTNNLSDDFTSQVKCWPPALYRLLFNVVFTKAKCIQYQWSDLSATSPRVLLVGSGLWPRQWHINARLFVFTLLSVHHRRLR